ncbi:MAG TPA: hypothetical protein ENH11_00220, partial [Candidatus Acetothermia bacterium]|nr:hypothetical protein [Candidatus Acetothermia bacterium]
MDKFPYDNLTHEEIIAKIEKVLRGKADGKGYTVEELDAYFSKSRETIATKEDFRKGFDRVMGRLNKLLAMATDMADRVERENAEWLRKQQSQDKEA